jgi:predicted DNA-binding protein (MmcQ/YjbR family)
MNRQELIDYCLTYPAAYEDYPFNDVIDDNASTVMRHKVNTKTFAIIFNYKEKLSITLKCEPLEADFLRQLYTDVNPGYHTNKVHWNTITLGGDVPEDVLKQMIDKSYDLIKPKARKKKNA